MGWFTSRKKESSQTSSEPDPNSLAAQWGVPQNTRLEWSPIVIEMSKAHKKPTQEPHLRVLQTTQMNHFHGLPMNQQEFMIQELMGQSCMVKSFMSGTMGYALGGFIGLFMYSTRTNAIEAQYSTATGSKSLSGTEWRGWRPEIKDMGRDMHRSGRNFGIIGGSFVASECLINTIRGKEDIKSAVGAGFLVGGLGGLRAGVGPALMGGVGFALFSYAIEQYMDRY